MLWHRLIFLSGLFHAQFLASQIFIKQNPAAPQHYLRSVKFFILRFRQQNFSKACCSGMLYRALAHGGESVALF
jgi:hypothetical protein